MHHRLLRVLVPAVIGVSALACSVDVPEEDESRLELYQVPAGTEDQVRRLLAITLGGAEGMPPKGTVAEAPGGRLLVLTTPRIHAGVADLVASLEGVRPPGPTPPIELTYWVLLGEPAPGEIVTAETLPEIQPALAAIEEELGPQRFQLLERVQVRGQSGEQTAVQGVRINVEQRASVVGDRVVARLSVSMTGRPAHVHTEVSLAPGELVVLAQTGSPLRDPREPTDGEARLLFYIVRARLIDG